MIGYIKGKVIEQNDQWVMVGVGQDSTIGYLIKIPSRYRLSGEVELYLHSHIREDCFDLYGFESKEEKALFLDLITVSGVGPRAALTILSFLSARDLVSAIVNEDRDSIVKLPGIGKKTAERILIDLREKLEKRYPEGDELVSEPSLAQSVDQRLIQEATEALLSLGYRESEIKPKVNQVFKRSERPDKVEDVIRFTLQQLNV